MQGWKGIDGKHHYEWNQEYKVGYENYDGEVTWEKRKVLKHAAGENRSVSH